MGTTDALNSRELHKPAVIYQPEYYWTILLYEWNHSFLVSEERVVSVLGSGKFWYVW